MGLLYLILFERLICPFSFRKLPNLLTAFKYLDMYICMKSYSSSLLFSFFFLFFFFVVTSLTAFVNAHHLLINTALIYVQITMHARHSSLYSPNFNLLVATEVLESFLTFVSCEDISTIFAITHSS